MIHFIIVSIIAISAVCTWFLAFLFATPVAGALSFGLRLGLSLIDFVFERFRR